MDSMLLDFLRYTLLKTIYCDENGRTERQHLAVEALLLPKIKLDDSLSFSMFIGIKQVRYNNNIKHRFNANVRLGKVAMVAYAYVRRMPLASKERFLIKLIK